MMVEIQYWDHKWERRTTAVTLSWGAFVPQGWKLEYTGWDAAEAWARSNELAQLAEQRRLRPSLGLRPRRDGAAPRADALFEAFTMLAALAQDTHDDQLGQLVTCSATATPGLLAKEAACIDVFSGGRLILGLGAGWYEREYQAYGYDLPARRHAPRGARGDDHSHHAALVRGDRDLRGQAPRVRRRVLRSEAARSRCPPLWVGGGGEKVTLRIAAQHADATNWQVGLDQFVHKSKVLEQHCDDRSAATSTRSCAPTAPTAACSTPRPTSTRGSTRPAAASSGAAATARRRTCATTSSAPSSRWPRRCRASSTPAAASSCSGSATSRLARASSASCADVVPLRG